ncbi:MAG: hypothetical protein WC369_01760 [Dehalococcoidales bacterium]|jgi:hypothetical protein
MLDLQMLFQYQNLLILLFGTVGGILLIDKAKVTMKHRIGVLLIFLAFLAKVYLEITQPWTSSSLPQVIFTSVMAICGIVCIFLRTEPKIIISR